MHSLTIRTLIGVGFLAVLGAGVFISRNRWLPLLVPAASEGAESHDDHHDEHDHGQQMTIVWKDVEVFIDYQPVIVGQPTTLNIHLTDLKTGLPLKNEKLDLKARRPTGDEATTSADRPNTAHVYQPELTLPAKGTYQCWMMLGNDPSRVIRLDAIRAFSSQEEMEADQHLHSGHNHAGHAHGDDAHGDDGHGDDHAAEDVSFSKEKQWLLGLKTEVAQRGGFTSSLSVPGKVVAPHPSEAFIPPPISGHILPPQEGHFPHVGDEVKQGQTLAIIRPSILGKDQADLRFSRAQFRVLLAELDAKRLDVETKIAAAQLDIAQSEADFRREQSLSQQGVTAGKRLIAAKSALDQAQSKLNGLRKLLGAYQQSREDIAPFVEEPDEEMDSEQNSPSRVILKSPIQGTIVQADATAGEYVDHDHPIFRVLNMNRLFIDAEVSEFDLAKITDAPGASYRLGAHPDEIVPILGDGGGRLVFVGSVVNPETRTVTIRYEVPNQHRKLKVDMSLDVLLETDKKQKAISVPTDALIDDGGEMLMFVQEAGETFHRKTVRVGEVSGNRIEVLEGLREGDRVVTKGAYAIYLSTLSSDDPHIGHHH